MGRILARDVLRGQPTVATSDVSNAQETIAELFGDHRLMPLGFRHSLDMKLRSVRRGGVGIEFLDYGTEVQIDAQALDDFFLVQIPLAGHARLQVRSSIIESTPMLATIPPLERPFTMTWDRGAPHLIVYVQRQTLAGVADRLFGLDSGKDLALGLSMDLKGIQGRAFLRSVVELQDEMAAENAAAPDHLHRLLAETMLSRLLMATIKPLGPAPGGNAADRGRLTRRFNELLERHSTEELSVSDIAVSLGVSIRTLQAVVRSELGMTPSELLRRSRLTRARELLLAGEPGRETVTSIAIEAGFSHLSRFSSAYLQTFGELPSESLHR
ncbi:AraC family transcriptional regulator [Arthrobacter sp. 24S4-2]|uniref:AraC family transcriptional regulator n=1 Tax=Arthrobacter sp. 24S4-2 TaxID=2575374 RepID=UPI0010C7D91B|nr:AraC family transcriptional regulator [Arthrobacter sp. 24S4-2]QCO97936.1 AraC family transcriptional regulator [Arthrobacter sp. 24S4-2]